VISRIQPPQLLNLEIEMKRTLAAALVALLPLCSLAADVTLEVEGLDAKPAPGSMLLVGVYTEAGQWMGNAVTGRQFPVDASAQGKMTVVLKDLPKGPLAFTLYHDANANGKLDMSATGMPMERYGFSNNAVGSYGPPKFEQAVLSPKAGTVLKIRMN
jgi:uncharacterized protein (DUF2141 family)